MVGRSSSSGGAPRLGTLPASADEETRALVQARLALFTKLWVVFLVLAAVLLGTLYEVQPANRPARAHIVHTASAVGAVLLGALWFLGVHRRPLSLVQLTAIDTINLVTIGIVCGISAYFSSDIVTAPHTAFIWNTFVAFSRAFVVPSSARRTAIVTAASYVPLAVAGIALAIAHPERLAIPPAGFGAGAVLLGAAAVVLATTGSHVIYGLRRQVREARRLGQYTLGERIGVGGMGEVYRARHALLHRPTAIKLLRADRYSPDAIARFEREVQRLSEMTHPNTVAVYDFGRSVDGVFYYAMEYLDGVDLETLVRTHGPLPAWRAIHVLVQVCGSLEEAHGAGLVHRDVKPANVILCRRGGRPDVAKVVDFGLVHEAVVMPGGADAPPPLVGTPAYLAPEVITGAGTVGPATDLYALGAVAYFLVTGRRVFEADTPLQAMGLHVTAAPEPPSRRTDAPIPPALEALILACLAKDPAARPPGAAALGRALAAIARDHPFDEDAARAWWDAHAPARVAPAEANATTLTVDLTRSSGADQPGDTRHVT